MFVGFKGLDELRCNHGRSRRGMLYHTKHPRRSSTERLRTLATLRILVGSITILLLSCLGQIHAVRIILFEGHAV